MNEVNSSNAPAAIGPYSQGIVSGKFLFLSGQIGLDPATSKLVSEDILDQQRQALANLSAVAEEAGSSLANAVKVEVYISDIDDYSRVNEVYKEFFNRKPYPARQMMALKDLPAAAKIEISAIIAL